MKAFVISNTNSIFDMTPSHVINSLLTAELNIILRKATALRFLMKIWYQKFLGILLKNKFLSPNHLDW